MFKYRENQAKLIDEKPFIFLESKTSIDKEAYIEWAALRLKKEEGEIHVFDIPYAYKFDILDKYRKKLVNTGYAPSQQGGSHLFSIFQLDKNQHIICTFHFDVEDLKKDFLTIVLISSKTERFIEFIKENKELEENFEPAERVGFNLR